ncbi:MAG: shikimate dehydrogenase [Wenzhouxiangellaceae bacterium]|nr:shikimate dehydrogenase [Wenzhouxiangellaceae bacterium]
MLKLAVFGHPVAHSLSPRIHRLFAEAAGVDVEYDWIDCPAGQLRRKLREFSRAGGRGCNLTVPLKAEGLALAASVSRAAREAGACNTLVAVDDGWRAENTDGAGLVADLARLGIDVTGGRVLVIGAGGAVAGVLGPLLEQGPARVCVLNRDGAKADRLVRRLVRPGVELEAAALADALADDPRDGPRDGNYDLLIQGTSLGHRGQCPAIDSGWIAPGAVGYDLNYAEAFEPFRSWCERAGLPCHSGLGMLVEQAALAFELFTGIRPDTAPVHAAVADFRITTRGSSSTSA